jgi:hypothetical protein
MATTRQKEAARENIRKAQKKWQSMSHREHALAQPQGRSRTKPGMGGHGEYYRIQVRPKGEFVTFRTQDIGRPGHTQRLAGKRRSGSWDTQAWLISKKDAHLDKRDHLVINKAVAAELKNAFRGPIVHEKGDIFRAKPRKNIPEAAKPTRAQRQARLKNIKKAQAAR